MNIIIGAGVNTKLATSKQPKLGNNITKDKMMNRVLLFFIGQIFDLFRFLQFKKILIAKARFLTSHYCLITIAYSLMPNF